MRVKGWICNVSFRCHGTSNLKKISLRFLITTLHFFFDVDECGLLSKKNRKKQQQIIIMPVILSLNLLKKNTSCCVGFQYSYAFSYWLYIWFFSLLIADRFWKFYRKFTLPPSRVKEKSRLSCVWFSFCGWGCGKVQSIYAQNSTTKANFSCFLWFFL